jgi:hypothetical protein
MAQGADWRKAEQGLVAEMPAKSKAIQTICCVLRPHVKAFAGSISPGQRLILKKIKINYYKRVATTPKREQEHVIFFSIDVDPSRPV